VDELKVFTRVFAPSQDSGNLPADEVKTEAGRVKADEEP
jgi:hypothetical protein